MSRTDEELMEDFDSGNKQAAMEIFEKYKSRILNFSLRILGSRADAEDVTGEVFLALLSGKYSFDPKAKFSTWLFTVARNSCITQIRKKKKLSGMWATNSNGVAHEIQIADSNESPKESLEKKEAKHVVKKAINELPFDQKEVIIMREYQKLSYNEISQILGFSLEKVKVLIFRARENLRVQLSSFLNEEESGS